MPSPGYRVSGKEVEVRDSGSRHQQLCGCCDLQLIQNHAAPSHGPPARVLPPLFFPTKSLLLPKPRGKKKHSKTSWSSTLLQNLVVLFPISEPLGPLPFPSEPRGSLYFRTTWTSIYLLASEPRGSPIYFGAAWSPLLSFPKTLWSSSYYFGAAWSLLPPKPCGPPYSLKPRGLFLWLPGLGLNPSAHLPLQPHF